MLLYEKPSTNLMDKCLDIFQRVPYPPPLLKRSALQFSQLIEFPANQQRWKKRNIEES